MQVTVGGVSQAPKLHPEATVAFVGQVLPQTWGLASEPHHALINRDVSLWGVVLPELRVEVGDEGAHFVDSVLRICLIREVVVVVEMKEFQH